MATRRGLAVVSGLPAELPLSDRFADQPRERQQATAPTTDLQPGDTWLNTETGVRSTWVVTASGGQWVGDDSGNSPQTFSSDIEITDSTKGIILRSPNGARWRVTVDNSGTLVRTSL